MMKLKIALFLLGVMAMANKSDGLIVSFPTKQTNTILRYARRSNMDDISTDEMRRDIEEMRQEALRKIEALNEKMFKVEKDMAAKQKKDLVVPGETLVIPEDTTISVTTATNKNSVGSDAELIQLMNQEREALESYNRPTQTTKNNSKGVSSQLKLMDDTRWRVTLNIGREPGTWMPKDWGISGERLYLNLELEFSPEQLYEREEFLNGISGTKVLKVVHKEGYLAPSLKEGGRKVQVKDGGWRVAPGEGPVGTTVLRFYVELSEQTSHNGSDVYAPVGRIYCTCGYFPMKDQGASSLKERLQKEHDVLVQQYEKLAQENERDDKLLSWEKIKRNKQMMDLRMQANKLVKQMNEAAVREPERSILRLSQDQSLGLTREGGVCCKVQKGLAIEYHILGKFEIASMKNREHNDYRESLRP